MKFDSWKEMYNYVIEGNDLYCPETKTYIFVYNDADALCCYYLKDGEADELVAKSQKYNNDYWSAFLGFGGEVLDDLRYTKYQYSKSEILRRAYLKRSFDFCKQNYKYFWINTKNYGKEIIFK